MAALAGGKSAIEAAVAAGVSRMTIYRWQHKNSEFMAALSICRQQLHDTFSRRLSTMHDKALSVIAALLDKGDFRAAKLVVTFVENQAAMSASSRKQLRRCST